MYLKSSESGSLSVKLCGSLSSMGLIIAIFFFFVMQIQIKWKVLVFKVPQ